jgi:hypothetical protein
MQKLRQLIKHLFSSDISVYRYSLYIFPFAAIPSMIFLLAAIAVFFMFGENPDLHLNASEKINIYKLITNVIVAPFFETIILSVLINFLLKTTSSKKIISLICGFIFGFFHGYYYLLWFFGTFWSFYIFTYSFLHWRKSSFKQAFLAAFLTHALVNILAMVISYFSSV